jgi:hypothetical protein
MTRVNPVLFAAACVGLLAVTETAAYAQRVNFTYAGKLVSWTVPMTGTYQILAFGAQGGDSTVSSPIGPTGGFGGRGAEIGGEFSLAGGEIRAMGGSW